MEPFKLRNGTLIHPETVVCVAPHVERHWRWVVTFYFKSGAMCPVVCNSEEDAEAVIEKYEQHYQRQKQKEEFLRKRKEKLMQKRSK